MTSKQVMLTTLVVVFLGGCSLFTRSPAPAEPLESPYPTRRVWAVTPLINRSGSLLPDGAALADQLQYQLEGAKNLDVLPVNRTIEAMGVLGIASVSNPSQAMRLMRVLGVDGLVVGAVTAYDPYDPPKLGMALELYDNTRDQTSSIDIRRLKTTPTDQAAQTNSRPDMKQPVAAVSAVFDAGDPYTREKLQKYAVKRGTVSDPEAWRRYRTSMNLYSEFVGYVMCWRLLDAERQRLAPPPDTQPAP